MQKDKKYTGCSGCGNLQKFKEREDIPILKRTKCYTTTVKRREGHFIIIKEDEYIWNTFKKQSDLLIEAMNMYEKYDSITFDFTKDERRK